MKNNLLLKDYKHDNRRTLKTFLYLFLNELNFTNPTLTNKGLLQCPEGKHRSLGDIHKICKSYFPKVTRKQVKKTLLNFKSKLVGHYCPDINKRVYEHKDTFPDWGQANIGELDEYGHGIYYL